MVQSSNGMQWNVSHTLSPSHPVTRVMFMCIFPETGYGSTHKITDIFLPPLKKKVSFSICTVLYLISVLFYEIYFGDYSLSVCKELFILWIAAQYPIVWLYDSSFFDEHWSCFQSLAVTGYAAVKNLVHISLWPVASVSEE